LISDWVDIKEKIYDEDNFMYIKDEKKIENIENDNIKLYEKDNNHLKDKSENKCKICFYCDFFKIFEN